MDLEKIIENKEEFLKTLLKVLEDKEAKAKLNFNGVKFHIGKSAIKIDGSIDITFIPLEEKKD